LVDGLLQTNNPSCFTYVAAVIAAPVADERRRG
jgi:hypothetical protein